jgi:hypothetical protein
MTDPLDKMWEEVEESEQLCQAIINATAGLPILATVVLLPVPANLGDGKVSFGYEVQIVFIGDPSHITSTDKGTYRELATKALRKRGWKLAEAYPIAKPPDSLATRLIVVRETEFDQSDAPASEG